MAKIPQRNSLHDQLVELLREGIVASRWEGELPSEAELCQEFQVSRMTLRKALSQLAMERWITLGGRGKRHRINRIPLKRNYAKARTIRLLTPFDPMSTGSIDHLVLTTFSERLAASGYQLKTEWHPRLFETFQPSLLTRLDAHPDTAGWVLHYATETIQRWFAGRDRPVVILGRRHEDIPLSSVYPDTEATARHAAGILYSRGHREMVYLIAELTSLSDRRASEVFVAEARRLGARARIVSYKAEPEPASRTIKDLIATKPRPTGFLIGNTDVAITLLCHLQAAGIRVPGEMSLIANWDDHCLNCTFPIIARYHTSGQALGTKLGAVMLDLIRHGTGKIRSFPILPEYVAGGSVGPGSTD